MNTIEFGSRILWLLVFAGLLLAAKRSRSFMLANVYAQAYLTTVFIVACILMLLSFKIVAPASASSSSPPVILP